MRMKYRPEIDGLRALAVIPVIMFHAGFGLFSGGFVGVDVFFVISGYLITTILIQDIDNNYFNIIDFYERRARRILPVLYVVVMSTLVASYFSLYPADIVSMAKSAVSIPFFSSNFFFWSERGYFETATELKPLIHTWSLAVEEQFYIIFPLLLILLRAYRKILYILITGAFILSLGASYYMTLIHFDTAFYFPFTRAWELLAGSFCAILLLKTNLKLSSVWADLLSLIGLSLIIYAYLVFDSTTLFPYINALTPVLGTALYIITSQNSNFIRRIFSFKGFVYVGLISYSLYLWHQPLFSIARHLEIFEDNIFMLIVATFILSIISYSYIERPFRNKDMVSRKTLINASLLGTVLIVTISFIYITNNGYSKRYSVSQQAILEQFVHYKGYNEKRFDAIKLKTFTRNESYKVVLIGDSYAKDFLNIIAENDLLPNYEFSSRRINSECGNLLLKDYNTIQKFIPKSRKSRCVILGRYEGEAINKILLEADEIWLISAWENWVIEKLPSSIQNLKAKYKKPIRVFGLKNFGDINLKKIMRIEPDTRVEFAQSIKHSAKSINHNLDNVLASYEYYHPIMNNLCGGDNNACKIFTRNQLLMSADESHLTKAGAIEAGIRLQGLFIKLKETKVKNK